jgi:hypothetical protein
MTFENIPVLPRSSVTILHTSSLASVESPNYVGGSRSRSSNAKMTGKAVTILIRRGPGVTVFSCSTSSALGNGSSRPILLVSGRVARELSVGDGLFANVVVRILDHISTGAGADATEI